MAKVQAPLFGFVAGGQLGEALVYSKWKGILYVRRYVIPANPNTEDQQTQRGYFAEAITLYHNTGYTQVDKTALDLWASKGSRPMSGFNKMISEVIRVRLLGDIWIRLHDLEIAGETPTTVEFAVRETSNIADLEVKLRFGIDGHFFGYTRIIPWNAVFQMYSATILGLQSGVKYYGWVEGKKAGNEGTIGLVTFKTT